MPDPKLSLFTCSKPDAGALVPSSLLISDRTTNLPASAMGSTTSTPGTRSTQGTDIILEFEALREGRTDVQPILQQTPRELTIASLNTPVFQYLD